MIDALLFLECREGNEAFTKDIKQLIDAEMTHLLFANQDLMRKAVISQLHNENQYKFWRHHLLPSINFMHLNDILKSIDHPINNEFILYLKEGILTLHLNVFNSIHLLL